MVVVDVHCHTFNADDLPVRGFIEHVVGHGSELAGLVARLLDLFVQGFAPGYAEDMARLNRLLGLPGDVVEEAVAQADVLEPRSAAEFDLDVTTDLRRLSQSHPGLVERLEANLADGVAAEMVTAQNAEGDVIALTGKAWRVIRWVKLFARSRVGLVADLANDYGGELDLAIPLLVDLGSALGDRAKTSMREQMVLFEKLSRASMLDVLPGARNLRLHPFVAFDPLAELAARRAGAIGTPLDLVRTAVEEYGFVGVKVYPPMGWQPTGNPSAELNVILRDFAELCSSLDVPVTAHGANSMQANGGQGAGSPEQWIALLDLHPSLRLDLGHFGGGPGDPWPREIAAAMADHPTLYADVGNHGAGTGDSDALPAYLAMLDSLLGTSDVVGERLMYGSDWYMIAIQPDHRDVLRRYRKWSKERALAGFMGANALRFLGFDDPANQNNARLRRRYAKFGAVAPAWLEG